MLHRPQLGMAVRDRVAELIRDVRDEVAPERDVQELHATADAEDGQSPRQGGEGETQLETVALRRDAVVRLVPDAAVVRGVDVAAPRENEGIDGFERLGDLARDRRE